MHLSWIALAVCGVFLAAYFSYGRFLGRPLDLKDDRKTPGCEFNDGADFGPAEKKFLLGQHFSAIAAAGPIVGPILAGLWFGWLPRFYGLSAAAFFLGRCTIFLASL